jgi:hypothetical protein
MSSNDSFSTATPQKQAEIVQKLMVLFKGNERFHGAGEVTGAKFNDDKNKWIPGHVRLEHKPATEIDWQAHLTGKQFLGLSPLQDDGTVWFTCIDVDKTEDNEEYRFDYPDEMGKIKRSGFPLVVFRTKSGGLRVVVFFSEPIEAELAVRRMKQIAAQLGYAGQEIFPKQIKVDVAHGDCPSWIYLPFGPAKEDMFPDQCCMNESGHAMDLYESIIFALKRRITMKEFSDLFVTEFKAKQNGKANGKNHPKGKWVNPEIGEPYEESIKTMFWDGPICLWYISLEKCTDLQHNFLFVCGVFLKRKYPDNWDKALEWVNYNVLRPVGDAEKLQQLIKDFKNRGDRPYEYPCKTPPICNRCHAHACKKQPFGVGMGNGIDNYELGMTIMKRGADTTFIVNVGTERIPFTAAELTNMQRYREKCLAYAITFPNAMKKLEWDQVLRVSMENATIVDTPSILQKDAHEMEMIIRFLDAHIPMMVRTKGKEFLEGKGKKDDRVRIRDDEQRIYFKWPSCSLFCQRTFSLGDRQTEKLRLFIAEKGIEHDRSYGKGGWFRSTISVPFDLFDPLIVEHWLHPDDTEEDGHG